MPETNRRAFFGLAAAAIAGSAAAEPLTREAGTIINEMESNGEIGFEPPVIEPGPRRILYVRGLCLQIENSAPVRFYRDAPSGPLYLVCDGAPFKLWPLGETIIYRGVPFPVLAAGRYSSAGPAGAFRSQC